jgi:hypothetical protein
VKSKWWNQLSLPPFKGEFSVAYSLHLFLCSICFSFQLRHSFLLSILRRPYSLTQSPRCHRDCEMPRSLLTSISLLTGMTAKHGRSHFPVFCVAQEEVFQTTALPGSGRSIQHKTFQTHFFGSSRQSQNTGLSRRYSRSALWCRKGLRSREVV